jgi:hypothetical protein
MNNCKGKIIVFDGDSICHGGRTNVNGEYVAWAGRVGESLEMDWYNYSIGGATIAAETYSAATGEKKHWITRYIDEIHEKHLVRHCPRAGKKTLKSLQLNERS